MEYGYRQLRVYQLSIEGVKLIYELCSNTCLIRDFSLIDQVKRAAMSLTANIAEGYGRETINDKRHFVTMSYGSINEVEALLDIVKNVYPHVEVDDVMDFYHQLGKQIYIYRKNMVIK